MTSYMQVVVDDDDREWAYHYNGTTLEQVAFDLSFNLYSIT